MKIVLLGYLFLGLMVNFIGPLAKKINEEFAKLNTSSLVDKLLDKTPTPNWKKILFKSVFRIICFVFYPILYIIITYDYFHSKKPINDLKTEFKDDGLMYYWKMGGAGAINCNECDFNSEIVSFLHGHGPESWNNSGFQCQNCGKFHEIECDMNNSKDEKCECGGELVRDMPIFCPTCKTKNVSYNMSYIT